jgi:hypothetical protein
MTRPEHGSPGAAASERDALPAGFYHLALLAVFVAAFDLRLRPVPGLPSLSLVEMVAVPTLLAAFAEMSLRPWMAVRRSFYRPNRPLVGYVGYAGLASVVGLVRSDDSLQAFHDLLPAFALYALVVLTVDTHARLRGVLVASFAAAIPGIALAVLQVATGGFYLVPLSENVEAKLDLAGDVAGNAATGLLAHPNGLALYLLPIALFLAVGAWRGFGRERRLSPALAAVGAVTFFVLAMTYAKGVYAWLVAGLLFLALPRRFERRRFWIALLVPVVGIVVLVWISIYAILQGDLQYGTVVSRIQLWLAALDILQTDGFVRVFGGGGPQLISTGTLSFEYPNPHNAWLSQALTYGIPALVLYLAAFGSAFRSLQRQLQSEDGATRAIALATMAALLALLGENFFEPADRGSVYQSQLCLLFALSAAGANVAARSVRPELSSAGPAEPAGPG